MARRTRAPRAVEPAKLPPGTAPSTIAGPIPAVAHLHGGEVPPVLDGGPDAWFTSDGQYHGHAYYTRGRQPPRNYADLPLPERPGGGSRSGSTTTPWA